LVIRTILEAIDNVQRKAETMTEQTPPARAGLNHPHDKHGHPVKKGQLVEFVWAGEHHKGEVEEISTDEHGHHYAHVAITTLVPCTAVSVRKDENPKAAEKEGSKVEHRPATHAPHTHEGGKK
jgi:hypothetical protein